MILKAGTYKFNGELNFDTIPFEYFESADTYLYQQNANYQFDENTKFQIFSFGKYPIENGYVTVFSYQTSIDLGATSNEIVNVYSSDEGLGFPKGWLGVLYEIPNEALQTHTLTQDTEVADEFGEWYISSTDYNEVNGIVTKPIATITYNGETIAQLNAGETATLSCEGKKMASDVVVKVNEVESKIPEGYVKPEGSLPITENGTYPVTDKEEVVVDVPIPEGYVKPSGTLELTVNNVETAFPIDCSKYAKVTVNTAEPLKITDPTVLDNITDSPYGVGGSVFLYEGATTDSYEKGTLYYLEDTDK